MKFQHSTGWSSGMKFCHVGIWPFSQGNLKCKPHISFRRQSTHLTILHVQHRGKSFQKPIHDLKSRISKRVTAHQRHPGLPVPLVQNSPFILPPSPTPSPLLALPVSSLSVEHIIHWWWWVPVPAGFKRAGVAGWVPRGARHCPAQIPAVSCTDSSCVLPPWGCCQPGISTSPSAAIK